MNAASETSIFAAEWLFSLVGTWPCREAKLPAKPGEWHHRSTKQASSTAWLLLVIGAAEAQKLIEHVKGASHETGNPQPPKASPVSCTEELPQWRAVMPAARYYQHTHTHISLARMTVPPRCSCCISTRLPPKCS